MQDLRSNLSSAIEVRCPLSVSLRPLCSRSCYSRPAASPHHRPSTSTAPSKREWDRAKEVYGPEKYSIRRYQKRGGELRQQSKLNISSKAQAQALIEALQKWLDGH